ARAGQRRGTLCLSNQVFPSEARRKCDGQSRSARYQKARRCGPRDHAVPNELSRSDGRRRTLLIGHFIPVLVREDVEHREFPDVREMWLSAGREPRSVLPRQAHKAEAVSKLVEDDVGEIELVGPGVTVEAVIPSRAG